MARGQNPAVVASKMAHNPDAHRLAVVALAFLRRAHEDGATFRLRPGADGRWSDDPPSDDAAGRALLGPGAAVPAARWPEVRGPGDPEPGFDLAFFDPATGGGFDGLEAHGVNRNQGAEPILAFVATMAQARALRRLGQAASWRPAAASASSRWGTDATAAPTHRSAAP